MPDRGLSKAARERVMALIRAGVPSPPNHRSALSETRRIDSRKDHKERIAMRNSVTAHGFKGSSPADPLWRKPGTGNPEPVNAFLKYWGLHGNISVGVRGLWKRRTAIRNGNGMRPRLEAAAHR